MLLVPCVLVADRVLRAYLKCSDPRTEGWPTDIPANYPTLIKNHCETLDSSGIHGIQNWAALYHKLREDQDDEFT